MTKPFLTLAFPSWDELLPKVKKAQQENLTIPVTFSGLPDFSGVRAGSMLLQLEQKLKHAGISMHPFLFGYDGTFLFIPCSYMSKESLADLQQAPLVSTL